MAEYSWLIDDIETLSTHTKDGYTRAVLNQAVKAIRKLSADVVPVVRCKDCKYNLANIPDIQDGMNINENWNDCQLTELYDSVEPMDFCSRGAKMDGGDKSERKAMAVQSQND